MYMYTFLFACFISLTGCTPDSEPPTQTDLGCDGQTYPSAASSPYVIPFAVGTTVTTGLGNCSSSYHAPGRADQYATDFDMPTGTLFVAARGGIVSYLDEDEPSEGGGAGNMVIVDHGDGTSALYLHSPKDGILVDVGDQVQPGDVLGVVGQSGLAGYPHLHFIVVEGSTAFPYHSIPVTFRNARPTHIALKSYAQYQVLPY